MNKKHFSLTLLLAITLGLFQPTAHAALLDFKKMFGPPPVDLDGSPTTEKSVKVDSFSQLKDCKKVVVTAFNVQFITKKKASAHAGSEGVAHVNADIKLTGLDNPVFQAITDQAYTNFLKSLTALGVEVMPYADYMALPQYAGMKEHMKSSPLEVSGGTFSSGLPSLVFAPSGRDIALYGDEAGMKTLSMMGATMGSSAPASKEPQIAKETGVAAVHVYIVVEFCQVESSGGTFHYTASVETKPQISISQISYCSFFFGNGMTGGREYVKLKNNAFGSDTYVTEYKDVTSTGQRVGDGVATAIGILGGTGGSYKTRSYEAAADPALYQAACVKYISTVESLMLEGIKAKMTAK